MPAKLRYLWDQVLNSYWFVPSLMTLGAILLSLVTLRIDAGLSLETVQKVGWLLYTGGPEGARGVLQAVAGSMITVAGVVFSITIVALTLASSQFGPRVLANFMRDRGNQIVLGTFIATYLFCLLVLRTIRNGDEASAAVVPHLSITTGLLLALASLAVLIFFIHHVAISIQAPQLIARLAEELHEGIDSLFPEGGTGAAGSPDSLLTLAPEAFDREAGRVTASHDGYVDAVDLDELVRAASERNLLLRLEYRPGHFVVRGSMLARYWPAGEADEQVERMVRDSVVLGPRRTSIQDVEFTVNQLVEVAVRALSPGINDPFTALTCLDRLGAGLCHLARLDFPSSFRLDERGELRLVIGRPVTFAGIVDAALHQIRQSASYHTAIYARLLEILARVVGCVRDPQRIEPLLHHGELVLHKAQRDVAQESDRADVELRFRHLLEVVERQRGQGVPEG
jgi:uncharacterized membrane protein